MFTGIVEELGEVVRVAPREDAALLTVRGPLVTSDAAGGDSIAVNGVCLTVVTVDGDEFTADVMAETLRRSALGTLAPGDPVNLERAAALGDRLGGHLVQGHVDAVATVVSRQPAEHWEVMRFALPEPVRPGPRGSQAHSSPPAVGFDRYLVEKGSITVDGVSLTVVSVDRDGFEVSLIPTTLKHTTLGTREIGDPVNLEVDVIAKYVEKMLGGRS
jgi:riboflavin synthase